MSFQVPQINGLANGLGGVLSAGVVVLHSAKNELMWWGGFWLIASVSAVHFTRMGIAAWIRIRDWRRRRTLTQWAR